MSMNYLPRVTDRLPDRGINISRLGITDFVGLYVELISGEKPPMCLRKLTLKEEECSREIE